MCLWAECICNASSQSSSCLLNGFRRWKRRFRRNAYLSEKITRLVNILFNSAFVDWIPFLFLSLSPSFRFFCIVIYFLKICIIYSDVLSRLYVLWVWLETNQCRQLLEEKLHRTTYRRKTLYSRTSLSRRFNFADLSRLFLSFFLFLFLCKGTASSNSIRKKLRVR